MRRHATEAGLRDAVIVNTCAVTGEAVRQATQTIRKLRRENPAAQIIVTGCAAQIEPERFAAMPEVDRVIGNAEKMQRETFLGLGTPTACACRSTTSCRCARRRTPWSMASAATHARLRAGAERLRSSLHVLHHPVRTRTVALGAGGRGGGAGPPAGRAGYAEVVLTGVDITSYGADLPGRA